MNTRERVSFWGLFKFSLKKRVLIIFSPDFKESDMKDGYYRRVAFCDRLLEERPRIVLDLERNVKKTIISRQGKKIVVVFSQNRFVRLFWMTVLMLLNRDVYCESVWQVKKIIFRFPHIRLFVDVHGSVPEEEMFYRNFEFAALFSDIEELVVKKAECLFCVTKAMQKHFEKKYGKDMQARVEILPIMDRVSSPDLDTVLSQKNDKEVLAVYAGGMFKWQNIERMTEIIKQNTGVKYEIYTPGVADFWKIYGKEARDNVKVAKVTPEELKTKIYPRADYGFVLRDDIVVNNVACPTKISEYLEYGIIPIVKSEKIGDFVDLGMKYIRDDVFATGKLYSVQKRREIIANNLKSLKKYYEVGERGIEKFKEIMVK